MRYNLEKRNRFAMRTLDAFSSTMFDLLETKSFETIMVSELCSLSNYPRATFYNYFEDKYDLLEYCWDILKSKVRLYDFKDLETDHRIYEVFTIFLNSGKNDCFAYWYIILWKENFIQDLNSM